MPPAPDRQPRGRTPTKREADPFAFGANWASFLDCLDEERVGRAVSSLQDAFGRRSLAGARFLDVGCGSGLFGLAARRLGAVVRSFDADPLSVACARTVKQRYCGADDGWQIEEGSVLDPEYLRSLGAFDVVYAWGVLHHTGSLWQALEYTCATVGPRGRLCVAIYNDQGRRSRWWRKVKRTYNRLPRPLRAIYLGTFATGIEAAMLAAALARLEPERFVSRWTCYDAVRGMSRWHDIVDWVGGYPFDVAKPDEVVGFCRQRGFQLERLVTCGGGPGCNEFVFGRP